MGETIDNPTSTMKKSAWPRISLAFGVALGGFLAARSFMRLKRYNKLRGTRFDQHIYHQIRTLIDGIVENPSAIDIEVDRGVVTLAGWIAESEVERLRQDIKQMKGINEIISFLETETARNVEFDLPLKDQSRSNRAYRESSETPPNLH